MRDRTRLELIAESNKIYRSLVWWIAVLVIAIIAMIRPATMKNEWLFVAVLSATIVAFVAIGLNVLRVNGLGDDEPEPPQPDDPSDALLFSEHPIRATRLENRVTERQTVRSIYKFRPAQWRRLYNELRLHNWKWRRKPLRNARVFNQRFTPGTYLTTADGYKSITREFARLEIIECDERGFWDVTDDGKLLLETWANMQVRT